MQKETILEILKELAPVRPAAEGFVALIETGNFSKDMLRMLSSMISEAIKETKDTRLQRKFSESQKVLEDIQAQEQHTREEESEDIESLEKELEGLGNIG